VNIMSENTLKPIMRFKGFNDDWERHKLGEISEIKTGPFGSTLHAEDYVEDGFPIITTEHFKNGELPESKNNVPQVSTEDYNRLKNYILNEEDIVFSRVGSVDINALVSKSQSRWLFSGRVLRVRSNNVIDSQYLHYELSTTRVKNDVVSRAVGQTMPSINTEILKATSIYLPKFTDEQCKIGVFFKQLDNTITLHQHELTLLKQRKKAFLQKMFPNKEESVPELRFNGFSGDWKEVKLGDRLNKNTIKNKDERVTRVESVSNKTGFTLQTDQFENRTVASDNLSNYYVIKPNMFAYNPSRINVGSIGYKESDDEISVVSPLYVSFSTKDMSDRFLWYWINSSRFERQRAIYSEGSVRDILSYNSLSEMDIRLPSLEEQQHIGQFFKTLDDTIEQHKQKAEAYKEMKQAFLQKMFV